MRPKHLRVEPGPGQESVWDYPRPPALNLVCERLRVIFAGETVAETVNGYRVLETSHPPVYYFPPKDVRADFLVSAPGNSFCEFKGFASYSDIHVGDRQAVRAAWRYPNPIAAFRHIKNHVAFYANRVDECWVGDERVTPQSGDFYGGWVTALIVGPFKGGPGTMGW